jgi:exosome complex RNA-binding protein Rrp42 (RNase PH superfamily)
MAQCFCECWYAIGPAFHWLRHDVLAAGSISTADGSALVRMGDTTIVCGVKAEIAEPELDRPEQGFLGDFSIPRIVVGAD